VSKCSSNRQYTHLRSKSRQRKHITPLQFLFHPGPRLLDGAIHIQGGLPHSVCWPICQSSLETPLQTHSEVCSTS
jgi:hypothetical protein